MKHLKLYEKNKNLIKKSKLVSKLLSDIYLDHNFQIFKIAKLDSRLDLMIEFSGDLNNSTYYKFDQLITILNKLKIKWNFSIGGGYIDISFEDESKIDKLITELNIILSANKYNL